MNPLYMFEVQDIKGEKQKLSNYQGKVLLIVNTASQCGFTPQYKDLEDIYKKYKDQGFEVLAFPCNQFGKQEPGSGKEIKEFCDLRFNISFPLFEKIDVNGDQAHPLFQYLKEQAPGLLGSKAIKWNFTKFLINRQGEVLQRVAPQTSPKDMIHDIEKLL